ncbi:MAG: hypothetical protein V1744_04090 [Candidatus Altiarchaeota archaeon]
MNTDRLLGKMLPYLVLLVMALIALYLYSIGSSATLDMFMVAAGVGLGLASSYVIYHSISNERQVDFFEGEKVILRSTDPKSYVVLTSANDQEAPLKPVKSTIYLTNLGLLFEPPDSGRVIVFIALDTITEVAPYKNAIRIRYMDPVLSSAEVLIYVDNRDAWVQTIQGMLSGNI